MPQAAPTDPAATPGAGAATDTEQRLAEALADLVRQIDIDDYRDSLGHPLRNNVAFIRAQAIVDAHGVSHEGICRALAAGDGDPARAARDLVAARTARPGDAPPEYRTWTTGP